MSRLSHANQLYQAFSYVNGMRAPVLALYNPQDLGAPGEHGTNIFLTSDFVEAYASFAPLEIVPRLVAEHMQNIVDALSAYLGHVIVQTGADHKATTWSTVQVFDVAQQYLDRDCCWKNRDAQQCKGDMWEHTSWEINVDGKVIRIQAQTKHGLTKLAEIRVEGARLHVTQFGQGMLDARYFGIGETSKKKHRTGATKFEKEFRNAGGFGVGLKQLFTVLHSRQCTLEMTGTLELPKAGGSTRGEARIWGTHNGNKELILQGTFRPTTSATSDAQQAFLTSVLDFGPLFQVSQKPKPKGQTPTPD